MKNSKWPPRFKIQDGYQVFECGMCRDIGRIIVKVYGPDEKLVRRVYPKAIADQITCLTACFKCENPYRETKGYDLYDPTFMKKADTSHFDSGIVSKKATAQFMRAVSGKISERLAISRKGGAKHEGVVVDREAKGRGVKTPAQSQEEDYENLPLPPI